MTSGSASAWTHYDGEPHFCWAYASTVTVHNDVNEPEYRRATDLALYMWNSAPHGGPKYSYWSSGTKHIYVGQIDDGAFDWYGEVNERYTTTIGNELCFTTQRIQFNIAHDWKIQSSELEKKTHIATHEFGHTQGLSHYDAFPDIMNTAWTSSFYYDIMHPTYDAIQGVVDLVGWAGTTFASRDITPGGDTDPDTGFPTKMTSGSSSHAVAYDQRWPSASSQASMATAFFLPVQRGTFRLGFFDTTNAFDSDRRIAAVSIGQTIEGSVSNPNGGVTVKSIELSVPNEELFFQVVLVELGGSGTFRAITCAWKTGSIVFYGCEDFTESEMKYGNLPGTFFGSMGVTSSGDFRPVKGSNHWGGP